MGVRKGWSWEVVDRYGYVHVRRNITAVKTEDEWFDVEVGLHQGSALSRLLFVIVIDVVSKEIKEDLSWEMLNADDLVLMAKDERELREKLVKWKGVLERNDMNVNIMKSGDVDREWVGLGGLGLFRMQCVEKGQEEILSYVRDVASGKQEM